MGKERRVVKFGGTSVGSPVRMRKVQSIITTDEIPKIVVLSAVSGTTNILVEAAELAQKKSIEVAVDKIEKLEEEYNVFIDGLLSQKKGKEEAKKFVENQFQDLKQTLQKGENLDKVIPAYGEVLSTHLFYFLLKENNINCSLINALDFMSLDEDQEPDEQAIHKNLNSLLENDNLTDIIITQGYVCRDHNGRIDNLKRGGSDYTASLIGAAIKASEVQIWTDIDGMHNNDPRYVQTTLPISELTFDEAAELAYFGAKILHPSSILPAQKHNIPVHLKSTLDEKAAGTIIQNQSKQGEVKAVAAKDGITAIKIKSSRMLLAYGFLRRIFEVFEQNRTSIDMVTTSEVAVSLTIDNELRLGEIMTQIEKFGHVEIDREQTIICIVGNRISDSKGVLSAIFSSLKSIPIRMVSYGGSRNNITLLIASDKKAEALKLLNNSLFKL